MRIVLALTLAVALTGCGKDLSNHSSTDIVEQGIVKDKIEVNYTVPKGTGL
jgi:hypothetical protein